MNSVRVYRFMYFDRATRKMVDSGDFATPEAIREIGAQILTHYLDVDATRVGVNGIYITVELKGSGGPDG